MSSTIDLSNFPKKLTVTGTAAFRQFQNDAEHPEKITSVEFHGSHEMQVSDGYHTMDELYDHRITLYIALCRIASAYARDTALKGRATGPAWRSKRHSDGELCFGTGTQFVLGVGKDAGDQITYHIPIDRWDETDFAETLDKAPDWDGHTSADVLERLKQL
jgi:hypothetical protein